MSNGEEIIDSHVSLSQCRNAVEALHSHELKKQDKFEEIQILPAKEQHIWLNVTVKKISPTYRLKPHTIPIVHSLIDPRATPVCLITKDPQRDYKNLLESHNIDFISRVVGIEKLKGKFKAFEARRMLLKENGMFLADQRVIPLLPKLLGSKWFEAKKQPIPVCLTRKDLKGELERALSSTYMNQNRGTCTSIKVGKMSQKPSQIVENISTAIPAIAKTIQGGWDNIQSLNIKTNQSVSLPIWSCTLNDTEGGRWHGLQAKGDGEDVGGDGEDEEESELKPAMAQARKRPSDSEKEEEMKPKKRAKGEDHGANVKGKLRSSKSSKIGDVETVSRHQTQRRTKEPLLSAKSSLSDNTAPPIKESKSVAAKTGRKKTLDVGEAKSSQPPSSTSIEVLSNQKSGDALSRSVSLRKTNSSSAATTVTTSSRSDGKAGKKEKSRKTSDINPAKPSKEITQKHSLDLLERKKQLVMKTKGRKSVKNAMLGKKVAQG